MSDRPISNWPKLRYFWLTIQHKWYVFLAGRRLGVSLWQLIIHDWSKFTSVELPAYGAQFFGGGGGEAFSCAWVHHQNHNPHHWEYWVTRSDHRIGVSGDANNATALEMPEKYAKEMVADWCGASRAYTGSWSIMKWVEKNVMKMNLHPDTHAYVLYLVLQWDKQNIWRLP